MSGSADSDILMYMKVAAGSPAIPAESTSMLNKDDTMTKSDFVVGQYFEIDDFSLNMTLGDDEGDNVENPDEKGTFGRWRGLERDSDVPDPPFRAEPDDVSFSRNIDKASPLLLQNCLDTKRFDLAVIVKRSRSADEAQMSTILRLEFQQVYVRAVEWEDGDTVRETCKFKFGLMKATYVKRNPDSSIAASFNCSWTSDTMKKSSFNV